MKAIQIIKNTKFENQWMADVALNYSQLSFDFSQLSRIDNPLYDFYVCNKFVKMPSYKFIIVLPAGTLLGYTYFERSVEKLITGEFEYYYFPNNDAFVYCPNGKGSTTLNINYTMPYVDTTTHNSFSLTHDSVVEMLSHQSNMAYLIHNEIPDPVIVNTPVEWAMTVSSGFYINYVLYQNGFTENTEVHHVDISKSSLHVRQHIIENWDGKDFFNYIDSLEEKFPLLKVYNGSNRLNKKDDASLRCWEHLETFFKKDWLSHWNKYKKCKHRFHQCNLGDNKKFSVLLEKNSPKQKNSVFWWNGGLKRLPANVLKTSQQSYQMSLNFLNTLQKHNPNLILYGSDHCRTAYNGINVDQALEKTKENSRGVLWKHI